MDENILLMADSYKVIHWLQYPPKTQYVYLYFESRGGKWDEIVFFGLQYIIKRYLQGKVIDKKKIYEAERFFDEHFGGLKLFNKSGWMYILKKYDGKMPLIIKAVPEGMVVNSKNVLMTIENTDPECFWLPSYLESLISNLWYPCTVATQSREMKKIISRYLESTGDLGSLDYKLVDFGLRGSTSQESAAIGGAAHLVNFKTSENMPSIRFIQKYYYAGMGSLPFPASEHSTIISWGKDKETDAYKNMLEKFPEGMIAIVCDSYDLFNACRDILGKKLKNLIEKHNGVVFVRPDSGNPVEIVPEVLDILSNKFGFEKNEKGYKILPPYLRMIQGDSIDYESIKDILKAIKLSGWSVDNLTFGSGGGLLQRMDRDTLRFTINCSNVTVNGESLDVSKSPLTVFKKSKSGRFALVMKNNKWITIAEKKARSKSNKLETVFKNGDLIKDQSFSEIKKRAVI